MSENPINSMFCIECGTILYKNKIMNLQFDVTDIEILIGELECLSMSLTAITNRMEIILEKAKHHLKFSKQNTPESKEYRRMLRMYEPFLQELALAEVRASLNEQKKSCL